MLRVKGRQVERAEVPGKGRHLMPGAIMAVRKHHVGRKAMVIRCDVGEVRKGFVIRVVREREDGDG